MTAISEHDQERDVMTVEQAASAVNEFKPGKVIPYHYRGKEGMSDIAAFERLVAGVKVEKLAWY